MSLYTDSDISTAELLQQMDPEVPAVVAAIGKGHDRTTLLLEGPGSICERAWNECRSKLESALAAFNVYVGSAGTSAHMAAVLNTTWYGSGTRAQIRLNQVVVHDIYYGNSLHPIQQWVVYSALRLVFQAASLHLTSNTGIKGDRYQQKERLYEQQQARLWRQIVSQGLPYVLAPLDCPGARHGWNAGTWDLSCLGFAADASNTNADSQNVRVAITYFDRSQYVSPAVKNNAESGPSETLSTSVPPSNLLTVDISSLNPPDKNNPPVVGISQGMMPFLSATHWNIYVGTDDYRAPLYLQTPNGIPIATTSYALPATFAGRGNPALLPGQFADPQSNLLMAPRITRG